MRLIDADALLERLKFKRAISERGLYRGLESAMAQVNKAPTVDAVEVVRCKDCKHYVRCWEDSEERRCTVLLDVTTAHIQPSRTIFVHTEKGEPMYKSPIEMLITDIQHQIVKQQDEEIYQAVLNYIPNIDKAELIRALQYDRDQYEKGFQDGQPKWIPVTERLPEGNTDVLTFRESGINVECRWSNYWDFDEFSDYPVTHWMPLPEQPTAIK